MNHLTSLLYVGLLAVGACFAQQLNPALPAGTLARTANASAVPVFAPMSSALVGNRARTLGSELSASGTLYSAVKDAHLAGSSTAEALQRLSFPAINTDNGLRVVERLIELRQHLRIITDGAKPVEISAATIELVTRPITVRQTIFTNGVTVLRK